MPSSVVWTLFQVSFNNKESGRKQAASTAKSGRAKNA